MKAKLTHEEAIDLVAQHGNPTSASANSEYSRGAILRALQRPPEAPPLTPEQLEQHNEALLEQASELRSLNKKLELKLTRAHAKTEDMVEAVYAGAYDAFLAAPPLPVLPRPKSDLRLNSEEVALWVMTDWQGAKKTASYNTPVMWQRVMDFARKCVHITEIQRKDHPVKKAVLTFDGDMIEGLFQFPTQAFEIDQTIFGQFTSVTDLIVWVVRYALANYEEVEVICEWGNHGRMGRKGELPRSDNIDRMVYEMAGRMLAGTPGLTKWENGPDDVQRVEIGNYRAILLHGDEVGRNGYASINTIIQHMNRWRSGALPDTEKTWEADVEDWDFRDVYIGHYHTHYQYSLANGRGDVYGTGSTESGNRYASVVLAANGTPSQRLHFIDPVRGRVTAQYKVFLDNDIGLPALAPLTA